MQLPCLSQWREQVCLLIVCLFCVFCTLGGHVCHRKHSGIRVLRMSPTLQRVCGVRESRQQDRWRHVLYIGSTVAKDSADWMLAAPKWSSGKLLILLQDNKELTKCHREEGGVVFWESLWLQNREQTTSETRKWLWSYLLNFPTCDTFMPLFTLQVQISLWIKHQLSLNHNKIYFKTIVQLTYKSNKKKANLHDNEMEMLFQVMN